MKKIEKVKSQLFIALSLLTITGVIVAIISIYFFKKIHYIYTVNNAFHSLHEKFTGATSDEQVYLYKETLEHDYYETKESPYLEDFKNKKVEIHKNLEILRSPLACKEFNIDKEIDLFQAELSKYETLFAVAVDKIKKQEYSDFEIELKLQDYVHEMELNSDKIGLTNILLLQKFEKEFLINKDEAFVMQLERKVKEINVQIWKNSRISISEKASLMSLMDNYRTSFLDVINITYNKGFKNEQRLSEQINQCKTILNLQLDHIYKKLSFREKVLVGNIEKAIIITITNIMVMLLFIFFVYPRKNSETVLPIEELMTNDIHEQVYSNKAFELSKVL